MATLFSSSHFCIKYLTEIGFDYNPHSQEVAQLRLHQFECMIPPAMQHAGYTP